MGRGYQPYDPNSGSLFPRHLDELIGPADPVRMVLEVTDKLDLSGFETKGRPSGQLPFHPLLMVRLLIWGYANGIYSSRKIASSVRRDISFMFLAGDCRPSYRAISRFRADHHIALQALFEQAFRLCAESGMVRLGHVALDGTVLKANTSKHKAMSYGRMATDEKKIKQEIEDLLVKAAKTDAEEDEKLGEDSDGESLPEELQRREKRLAKIQAAMERIEDEKRLAQGLSEDQAPQIEDKEQRSFADPEARIMLAKRGGFEYGYNAQIAVDEQAGVIVACDLDNRANDGVHLPEMVDAIRQQREVVGDAAAPTTQTTMDAGYFSSEAIAASDGNGIELLVSPGREGKDTKAADKDALFNVTDFAYDDERRQFTCPAGRLLVLSETSTVRFVAQDCDGCPLRPRCLKPGESRREIVLHKSRTAGNAMRAKMKTLGAKAIYKRRKCTVEPVFGQIKWDRGFDSLSMRGRDRCRSEFRFVCAVHNLLKWVSQRLAPTSIVPTLAVAA